MNLYFEDEEINRFDDDLEFLPFWREIDNRFNYEKIEKIINERTDTADFRSNNIACLALAYKFWDEENHQHNIFLKDKNGKWNRIKEYTDKDLRFAHNIEKMYIAGSFGYCPADREVV